MGKIIQQSIKGSIWSYLGLIVGYVNVGIIMPAFFLAEQIGLVQLLVAISNIFTNFSSLGFTNVINRMFPEFRNKDKNHHGFLFLTLATGTLGFIISVIAFFILKPHIIESNTEKSPLLVEYIILLIPMFFFRIFYNLLDTFNRVLYDAVTGVFWADFIHKSVNLVLIILFAAEAINFRIFFYGYITSISFPVFPLIFVLAKRGEFNIKPNFKFLNKPLVREMIIVSGFGLVNGLSGVLTGNVDKLLISHFLSLENVGIFSVCALFATVIYIPSRSTIKITTGIIAQAWKTENLQHIQDIYRKSSITQTIIGSLIFIGIIVNLDNIFTILPETYSQGKWVLILYSVGTLIAVTNTNGGTIIATSKYYRVLSLIIASQIIYTLAFHMSFIPLWGITGAAIAVFATYLIRSLLVIGFVKYKFGMFCYSPKHLLVILFASIAACISYLIPITGILIVDILIKSAVVTVIYISLILKFKISVDVNILFNKLFSYTIGK